MRSIVYLINVDWFFVSHFMHLARRAQAEGYTVVVATEVGRERARLEAAGFEVIALPGRRSGLLPAGVLPTVEAVAHELRRRPEAVLHGFGHFGVLVGAMAAIRARHPRRVYTVTGRGFLAVGDGWTVRSMRQLSRWHYGRIADGAGTRWIVENLSDIADAGLMRAQQEGRLVTVGGAGVDPDVFHPAPMPPRPPLRVGLVARMIWTKGVDLAVEAVERARSLGADVELTLAGIPDPANPRSLSEAELAGLARRPGVSWVGRVDDVPAFWRTHHVALLPSRGGEGVPKSLIEAAACGRPILTTDVPGCVELARDTGGWVVASEDAGALAGALVAIAADPRLGETGGAARTCIIERYSEEAVWRETKRVYVGLMQQGQG